MRLSIWILFIGLLLGTSTTAYTQDTPPTTIKRSNNKVSLNGKPYYIHIVRKGETLFAISQAYKVPVDTIKHDNLNVHDAIQPNQYIKIRIEDNVQKTKQQYIYHTVVKGDTPFNLSKRYNTTIDIIYQLNPTAELGIKIGQVLKIPSGIVETEPVMVGTDSINGTTPTDSAEQKYLLHIVRKKETLFGIAAQYKVSKEEIEAVNPTLENNQIQPGEALKIPINAIANIDDKDYYLHEVKKQETIWGITQMYNIKEKALKKINPEIKTLGLQVGMFIRIPKNKTSDAIFKAEPIEDVIASNDTIVQEIIPVHTIDSSFFKNCPTPPFDKETTYKVAFFLPFYLNMIDTATVDIDGKAIDMNAKEKEIYPRSKIFIDFYEGALLAINDLKQQGVSFDIHVFDTQNDSLKIARTLKENDLSDFDLFIGPVFGENLNIVGDFAWEHQINIVSPLSVRNSFIDHNPYAFQVSPPFELQMKHASEFLNEFDTKNYIVIHDGKSVEQNYIQAFKTQLYAQMNDSNFDQIKYNEVYYYTARDSVLKDVFSYEIENIVIVPSSNRAFVSDIMGKLNGYSFDYKITTFGQPRWVQFDNIELDNFHNTNTHIFSNSYIEYDSPKIIDFIKDYRFYYKTEPGKYAFQGYDITYYFLSALNINGPDFRKCIHNHNIELLQTNYNFMPYTDQGGYQNSAIYILEYTDDYKIKKVASYPPK